MPTAGRANSGWARRDMLKVAALAVLPITISSRQALAQAPAPPHLWGVNLAGADFGKLLGTHGTEYLYPTATNIDYFAGLGFSLLRIPFKWERLQPELNDAFAHAELAELTRVTRHALGRGLTVVLDAHNYAKRRLLADGWARDYLIGSREVPLEAFTDFWCRLADLFKADDKVFLGLMNEPNGITARRWLDIANGTIAAIRARGARNMILVPGTAYTGAHSWLTSGNGVMEGVTDPARNFAFDVHQYLDGDSSGTSPAAVSSTIGSERIAAFQNWARQRGFRAFLGEYNGGRDELSARALMDLCDELNANADVWLGSAAWAGGPRWPEDEMFNLEPYADGRIREQTEIIRSRADINTPKRYWAGASPSLYADFARGLMGGLGTGKPLIRSAGNDRPEGNGLAVSRKGLPAGKPLFANVELAELFTKPDFTIIVELGDIGVRGYEYPLLSVEGARLLYRTASGGLASDLGLATQPQARQNAGAKSRYGLSVSAATGEIAIGTTGAPPVLVKAAKRSFAEIIAGRSIQIGGEPAAAPEPHICRIIGFPVFLRADALAANLA